MKKCLEKMLEDSAKMAMEAILCTLDKKIDVEEHVFSKEYEEKMRTFLECDVAER